jgi:hypothetical protein
MNTYFKSLLSEWQKTRKSAASWLVLIGGLFIPLVMIFVQTFYPEEFSPKVLGENYWGSLFKHSWESMAILLLPVGVILATSLITQLEYRNNTWKQVFCTPQRITTLFITKLTVVLVMMLEFFLLNFIGLFIAAYLPGLVSSGGMPPPPPMKTLIYYNILFFICSLPLLAFQFLIAMRFRNFLVSIGVGFGMVVASLFAFSWKYGYQFPFAQIGMIYSKLAGQNRVPEGVEVYQLSLIWFFAITVVHYILYIAQKERGT